MEAVRDSAVLAPLHAGSFGQCGPWEPPRTKRGSSLLARRSHRRSPRTVGLACTSRQQTLRNNVGEVFFPHAVRFDVPLGLNARPPGAPGTVTEGRRRRVAHKNRLQSGWCSPRSTAGSTLPNLTSSRTAVRPTGDVLVAAINRNSHTYATTVRFSESEMHDREMQQIFHVIREQIHENRSLYGKTCYDARSLFDLADRDSSGSLSTKQFSDALLRLGVGLTEQQVAMVADFMDTDNNGSMDYGEFILNLVVGDPELEEEEAKKRHVTVQKLRSALWQVRAVVREQRLRKTVHRQKEIRLREIEHHKKKIDQTVRRIEASNEHRMEASSLKLQASVLEQDGDYGGALATLERAKTLTPHDPSIQMHENQIKQLITQRESTAEHKVLECEDTPMPTEVSNAKSTNSEACDGEGEKQ